jgi:hypothetical protein
MVFTPTAAFIAAPGQGAQDLPEAMKDSAMKDSKRDPLYVAQHADDSDFSFRADGSDKVGDVTANVLEISYQGSSTRWLVDDKGQVIRSEFKTNTMQGPVQREVDYSDYRPVEGVSVAFKRITKDNGEVAATTDVKSVKLNPQIDASAFAKPAN